MSAKINSQRFTFRAGRKDVLDFIDALIRLKGDKSVNDIHIRPDIRCAAFIVEWVQETADEEGYSPRGGWRFVEADQDVMTCLELPDGTYKHVLPENATAELRAWLDAHPTWRRNEATERWEDAVDAYRWHLEYHMERAWAPIPGLENCTDEKGLVVLAKKDPVEFLGQIDAEILSRTSVVVVDTSYSWLFRNKSDLCGHDPSQNLDGTHYPEFLGLVSLDLSAVKTRFNGVSFGKSATIYAYSAQGLEKNMILYTDTDCVIGRYEIDDATPDFPYDVRFEPYDVRVDKAPSQVGAQRKGM